eukprot:2924573-Rhodomonas_salina.1
MLLHTVWSSYLFSGDWFVKTTSQKSAPCILQDIKSVLSRIANECKDFKEIPDSWPSFSSDFNFFDIFLLLHGNDVNQSKGKLVETLISWGLLRDFWATDVLGHMLPIENEGIFKHLGKVQTTQK